MSLHTFWFHFSSRTTIRSKTRLHFVYGVDKQMSEVSQSWSFSFHDVMTFLSILVQQGY